MTCLLVFLTKASFILLLRFYCFFLRPEEIKENFSSLRFNHNLHSPFHIQQERREEEGWGAAYLLLLLLMCVGASTAV